MKLTLVGSGTTDPDDFGYLTVVDDPSEVRRIVEERRAMSDRPPAINDIS